MEKNKICAIMTLTLFLLTLSACSQKKPQLEPTQVVNGKSIVMPPEFYVLPKSVNSEVKQ